MMFFTKESALVQTWVDNVREKKFNRNHVPDLLNLKDVVYQILDKGNAA